ncbi:hypothetical protein [Dietzia lutea]|uniref:Glycosyl hydrolase family 32 N-terminal domain-containing protein n=1 Tax=Dietzia lutea TaxID=546160 RepID=A0A2S1R5A9_9ACTN|nr:hypothetical protein [Dietzia lutea]AWH91442.1 hypothetical protein A6035_03795 [Dietzia lutea]
MISSVAPDPSVQCCADGGFHVHATSDYWGDGAGRRLVPHFRSFDLVEWEYVGDEFAAPPAWAPAGSLLRAPDVHLTDAGPVMFYTTGGAALCIGRATAPVPYGRWAHDAAPIVCYGADEPYQDLDPMDRRRHPVRGAPGRSGGGPARAPHRGRGRGAPTGRRRRGARSPDPDRVHRHRVHG